MWHCDGHSATFRGESIVASTDLTRPDKGLADVSFRGETLDVGRLLGADWQPTGGDGGETIEDHYVRGRDLVVTYAQTPSRSVRPQLYWRVYDEVGPLGQTSIECIVSMQTSLLDSNPAVDLVTEFEPREWRILASRQLDGAALVELSPTLAVLLMPHPNDLAESTIALPAGTDEPLRVRFRLFTEHLEKGVIRRGRVRACLFSQVPSQQDCGDAYREFRESAPPLTT